MKTKIEECPVCGSKNMVTVRGQRRFPIGVDGKIHNIVVKGLTWEECSDCHEIFLDDNATKIIEAAQFQELSLLSPAELKSIRQELNLSQTSMARLLGVGAKSYLRWETGLSVQNKAMDNLIRLIVEKFKKKEENTKYGVDLSERFEYLDSIEECQEQESSFLNRTPVDCSPVAMYCDSGRH
ncbi:MAG: type II toxin-antitoxin system MqsA family antitoxin [Elusimicrobia bacterium]|nr:type II toxin-antitoxin system MqsA family antitoxin [Elusimicrobiota bacterium]